MTISKAEEFDIRNKLIMFNLLLATMILPPGLEELLGIGNIGRLSHVQHYIGNIIPLALLTPLQTPTAIAHNTNGGPSSGLDPIILAALIGAAGAIVGAIVGAFATVMVSHHLEHKKAARTAKEQARKRKEAEEKRKEEAKRTAKSIEELVALFRDALRNDPNISTLKILTMSSPLHVTDVYVRLRIRDLQNSYQLDSRLLAAETLLDPNELLKAGQLHLESLTTTALDPDKAIRQLRHCVILGDPGAGKTTLLKHLALQSINNKLEDLPDIPIHIELNAFASSGNSDLLDYASTKWDRQYGFPKDEAKKFIKMKLENNEALLLLDALDEAVIGRTAEAAEETYRRTVFAIKELHAHYPRSFIVITARKAGYQQRLRLQGFIELDVLDFSRQAIMKFIDNWFKYHPNPARQGNAEDLKDRLENNPRILALAGNPLLLSLIVIVYEAQLDLPDRRAELYRQCVDTLLTKWDAERDIRRRRQFKPDDKKQLLGEIAWHFHIQGRRYFPEKELLKVIADFLPALGLLKEQNSEIFNEIASENGLLKEQAQGWHGFLHLTLQEYFVAQQVDDQGQLETLLTHRGDPWWEEVILLYAGDTSNASRLIEKLLGEGKGVTLQEDIFCTNLLLAGHCLAARPTIRQAFLREKVISQLFDKLITTDYSLIKQQAADTLIEIGYGDINSRLIEIIRNNQYNWDVQLSIINAIGKFSKRSMLQDLLVMLSDQKKDLRVRIRAAEVLGDLGETSVMPQLLKLLSNQNIEPEILISIAFTLGALGVHTMASSLVPLLSNSNIEWKVRRSIADILSQVRNSSIVPLLLPLLFNNRIDIEISKCIINALAKFDDFSVPTSAVSSLPSYGNVFVPKFGTISIASILHQLIADTQIDWRLRAYIVDVLKESGKNITYSQLLSLVDNPYIRGNMRASNGLILIKLGERSMVPELIEMLTNPQIDSNICKEIVEVLGGLGERSVVSKLLPLLSNSRIDLSVRASIADTIGKLGDKTLVPELLPLLSDSQVDPSVRASIADTIGKLGDKTLVPELLPLLSDSGIDSSIRGSIATFIEQVANDLPSIQVLAALLDEHNIKDSIHRILWTLSRRARIRIFIDSNSKSRHIHLVKWGSDES